MFANDRVRGYFRIFASTSKTNRIYRPGIEHLSFEDESRSSATLELMQDARVLLGVAPTATSDEAASLV